MGDSKNKMRGIVNMWIMFEVISHKTINIVLESPCINTYTQRDIQYFLVYEKN